LNGKWVQPDTRDELVDFVRYWSRRAQIAISVLLAWIGLSRSKFYAWRKRYGALNEHNSWVPRDFWLEPWEKKAILEFHRDHPREGYRRLTYMMMDADVVAASPTTVYRTLKRARALGQWNAKPSKKGTGFHQPDAPHRHWHIDVSYINIKGTFYYLTSLLDGYSRFIVHWEIRESMKEREVETILQRAREKFPHAKPRVISDNGPQFIARDFKRFIRVAGMTHVRTSPYYPQSNGKVERWHRSIKSECIRPKTPLSLQEARRDVEQFVDHYNDTRLHSAVNYVAPRDALEGRTNAILADRERKLNRARERRKLNRNQLTPENPLSFSR